MPSNCSRLRGRGTSNWPKSSSRTTGSRRPLGRLGTSRATGCPAAKANNVNTILRHQGARDMTEVDNDAPTAAGLDDLGFDPEALRERYRQERTTRLRPEGVNQYGEVQGGF